MHALDNPPMLPIHQQQTNHNGFSRISHHFHLPGNANPQSLFIHPCPFAENAVAKREYEEKTNTERKKKEEKARKENQTKEKSFANDPRRVLLQILNQISNIRQVLTKHILLPLTRQRIPTLHFPVPVRKRITTTIALPILARRCSKRPPQFTTTPLQQIPLFAGPRDGRGFGHEIKVKEFHGFEFDVAGGGATLEDGGDGQEAVELFKGACVLGGLEEGDDEDLEGGGLDCGTVYWFEEVEEEL